MSLYCINLSGTVFPPTNLILNVELFSSILCYLTLLYDTAKTNNYFKRNLLTIVFFQRNSISNIAQRKENYKTDFIYYTNILYVNIRRTKDQ